MHRRVLQHLLVDDALDLAQLLAAVTALKCAKSKRRRSGATSEPACLTCVPSTWRSAACSRCVAVWLRRVASRTARRRRP